MNPSISGTTMPYASWPAKSGRREIRLYRVRTYGRDDWAEEEIKLRVEQLEREATDNLVSMGINGAVTTTIVPLMGRDSFDLVVHIDLATDADLALFNLAYNHLEYNRIL